MSSSFSPADHTFMVRALHLAQQGRYTTDPNPRVGCVLVKDEQIVGEGFHQRAGEPHAEPNALAAAGAMAHGATAYVTLEPCCHTGRTPPCTQALLAAGVARVVVAMVDPNPLVAGKGLAQLREAGVQVHSGLLEQAARALNPGFIQRMAEGRPWVRLKQAISLDGRTAMASGESQWITSEAARRDVQYLRAGSSAVVTGIGTVLADDPSMNVRLSAKELPGVTHDALLLQPLRVVLDSQARLSTQARMLRLPGQTLVCVGAQAAAARQDALRSAGAEVEVLPLDERGIAWDPLLRRLAQRGCNEVLLECGAQLAGSALQAGVVDELIVYLAPHLMGDQARGMVSLPGISTMAERIQLRLADVRQIGPDLRLSYRPEFA